MRGLLLPALLALAALAAAGEDLDCEGATVEVAADFAPDLLAVYGYPALFGPQLNATATPQSLVEVAEPVAACSAVRPAAQPGATALVTRGNCSFLDKALAVQAASYSYMILYNTEPGCILMAATGNASAGNLTIPAVSVSQAAVQLLRALAERGGNVTLRAPDLPRVDYLSAAALWVMAVSTVVAGSLWSAAELRHHLPAGGWPGGQVAGAKVGGGGSDVTVITSRGALMFILLASAMLLLLYFFLNTWFTLLLVVLFAFGGWQTLSYVLLLLLLHWAPPKWARAAVALPRLGPTSLLSLAAGGAAAGVAVAWFLGRHTHWAWALQDVLGISLMLVILQQLRLPNLKVASILLPSAFVYDVWWVFIQPLVTSGDSVMIAVARGGRGEQLPMLLEFPRCALGSNVAYSMLGFGDVILPGLLAVFAARVDAALGLPAARGYFAPVACSYGVGLILTYAALVFEIGGSQGQPALLYLVPCTLGTISLLAWWRGQFGELWRYAEEGGEGRGGQAAPQHDAAAAHMEEGLEGERRTLLSGSQSPTAGE